MNANTTAPTLRTIEFCAMCDDNEVHTSGRCESCGHRASIA